MDEREQERQPRVGITEAMVDINGETKPMMVYMDERTEIPEHELQEAKRVCSAQWDVLDWFHGQRIPRRLKRIRRAANSNPKAKLPKWAKR